MTPVPTEDWRPTEWFDDGEPEDLGIRLDHEDLGTPWSNITPGKTRVRFKTPNSMRRGTVMSVKKRSMLVQFDGMSKPTAIPDAKWYYVQGRMGNLNEHLVTIATPAPKAAAKLPTGFRAGMSWITPGEAAAILGTDPKNIRRMIRSGKLEARREGGRWALSRDMVEGML
jgi:excisionase family DNA binding protein